ncbi:MAG: hypothetical protein AAF493_11005 [Pseudomonadota bacterium]
MSSDEVVVSRGDSTVGARLTGECFGELARVAGIRRSATVTAKGCVFVAPIQEPAKE